MHFRCPSLSEWQLCFSCQDRLNRAPINKHRGGEMETRCPSGDHHRGCTNPTFSKSPPKKPLSAFDTWPTCYLDLAFCLAVGAAAGAGFAAGSGAAEGLREPYRLRHLPQNVKTSKEEHDINYRHDAERTAKNVIYDGKFTYMFLIFFTKALTALTILLIRTCRRNNMWVSASNSFFIQLLFLWHYNELYNNILQQKNHLCIHWEPSP